jgi:hypothetical protein
MSFPGPYQTADNIKITQIHSLAKPKLEKFIFAHNANVTKASLTKNSYKITLQPTIIFKKCQSRKKQSSKCNPVQKQSVGKSNLVG